MSLAKHYLPDEMEPKLQTLWDKNGTYHFNASNERPVYSIDTPPPTVSGNLHLGHIYSYTHTDVFARFHRMRGENVFYPMGYDDNGLPTERLVEQLLGVSAPEIGRHAFIEKCLQVSKDIEEDYQKLWQRLGLSIDWRYTYRTIDDCAQLTSQRSFIDLYRDGLIYRQEAPTIWCPECQTGIAQADVDDLERNSEYITLAFQLENGEQLPIATTRTELLPACVAVFVHPEDDRYVDLVGQRVSVPLFDRTVTIFQDPAVDQKKGTGAVMCCTFGDTIDKQWWYTHHLDHVQALDQKGKLTNAAGEFSGLSVSEARRSIKTRLDQDGFLLESHPSTQIVPVHERCETPVEFIMSQQWFIRLLDYKEDFLAAGEKVEWHPEHMKTRYRSWVENLAWDWCISRQRYYGIPFPLWYCGECGEVILAELKQLPVNPAKEQPRKPCKCGSSDFIPDEDILETWATSSLSPQIVGRWLCEERNSQEELYAQVSPFSLRPQSHEIIRTWAFYTIVKSHFHFKQLPWKEVAISGWGIAGAGMSKISKSKGGGPLPPEEMIKRYSADAVRYWAVSTGLGKDAVISEEKIQIGAKLATKLWNIARFSERFLAGYELTQAATVTSESQLIEYLSPADRWILSRSQKLISRVTQLLESYDYAAAKSEIENFFWSELADNYLEMCKQRLYTGDKDQTLAAQFTLYNLLLTLLKLLAPFLPYITEKIFQVLFAEKEFPDSVEFNSIHLSAWPETNPTLEDEFAEEVGAILVGVATAVRRYKSENNMALGANVERLLLTTKNDQITTQLEDAKEDLISITRAKVVAINNELTQGSIPILESGKINAYLIP